jgi:hypothetical protein
LFRDDAAGTQAGGTASAAGRWRKMNYVLAAATLAMMGYMLGLTMFRMRRDRVLAEREITRGKFAFRPRERVRLLLNRAFAPSSEKAQWEDPLISRLSEIPTDRR